MKKGYVAILVIGFVIVFLIVLRYTPLFHGNRIEVKLMSPIYISNNSKIDVKISDPYGVSKVSVYLVSDGTRINLLKKSLMRPKEAVRLVFKPEKILPQGKSSLVIEASDFSGYNFFSGFSKRVVYRVTVDNTPPVVYLLSGTDYIREGGTALAIFYAKDSSGIKDMSLIVKYGGKGIRFKPYSADSIFHNKHVFLSFFTYPISPSKNWSTSIVVQDKAGNVTRIHVPVYYSLLRIRKSRIKITDSFIRTKVLAIMNRLSIPKRKSLLEDFLYVNDVVRKEDSEKIREICSHSVDRILWRGAFSQLFDSKVTSVFGEKRYYYYKGRHIDTKYHMGYDLASVRNAKVNAANSGVVAFEGYLGIYGNALIIDHGFGVFSLYGHLNSFLVHRGEKVSRNQIVAITDTTGLAGGDHLHFDVLVDGYYVNPLEFWDAHWLRTHVLLKIKRAKTRLAVMVEHEK